MKITYLFGLACMLFASVVLAGSQDQKYNYEFPKDKETPFEKWKMYSGESNKAAAEFAATFAAKMMTIVSSVEDTPTGKQARVVVADQKCIIDLVPFESSFRATKVVCSKKPFNK